MCIRDRNNIFNHIIYVYAKISALTNKKITNTCLLQLKEEKIFKISKTKPEVSVVANAKILNDRSK